jgi:hypothetical protein
MPEPFLFQLVEARSPFFLTGFERVLNVIQPGGRGADIGSILSVRSRLSRQSSVDGVNTLWELKTPPPDIRRRAAPQPQTRGKN